MDDHRREPANSNPLLARNDEVLDLRHCDYKELFNAPPIGRIRLLAPDADADA